MKTVLTTSAIVGSLWASPSVAQASKEYALMGKNAYSAFECSLLASYARNESEQRRLFEIGYAQGKTFIEALTSGKIQPEDVKNTVPVGVWASAATVSYTHLTLPTIYSV